MAGGSVSHRLEGQALQSIYTHYGAEGPSDPDDLQHAIQLKRAALEDGQKGQSPSPSSDDDKLK